MATTTTNYVYDKSGRMTTQWSTDTADATYFTYNQRDMVTQIKRLPVGGDTIRYFTYNGVGERTIVVDGGAPNYWTYDGHKLLVEKDTAGAPVNRYRHNDVNQPQLESNLETKNLEFGTDYPVRGYGGNLDQQTGATANALEFNIFAEVQNSSNPLNDRLTNVYALGTQALTTTNTRLVATAFGGIYDPRLGLVFGGSDELRGAFGLLLASLLLDCGGGALATLRGRPKRHGKDGGTAVAPPPVAPRVVPRTPTTPDPTKNIEKIGKPFKVLAWLGAAIDLMEFLQGFQHCCCSETEFHDFEFEERNKTTGVSLVYAERFFRRRSWVVLIAKEDFDGSALTCKGAGMAFCKASAAAPAMTAKGHYYPTEVTLPAMPNGKTRFWCGDGACVTADVAVNTFASEMELKDNVRRGYREWRPSSGESSSGTLAKDPGSGNDPGSK